VSWLVLILRIVLGAIFIVAGGSKIGHADVFAAQIAGFRLLAPAVIAPIAIALPFLEILLGIYLISGCSRAPRPGRRSYCSVSSTLPLHPRWFAG